MEVNNSKPSVNSHENPVQSQPTSHPTLEHPVKNPRGNHPIILGVLVLLFIVGGGAYYLGTQNNRVAMQFQNNTNTPEPTNISSLGAISTNSEYKTYQGQSYSFQYPSDWTIVKSDTNSVTIQKEELMQAQGAYPAQKAKVTISVYAANVQPNITLDKWLEGRYLRSGDANLFELTKQSAKKTTLGGAEALAVQVPGAGGYIDEGTISVYNGKGYDISIGGFEIQGSAESYQAVVSTFKFAN